MPTAAPTLALALVLFAACNESRVRTDRGGAGSSTGSPAVALGTRTDLTAAIGGATHAALGDLDADGKAELVVVDAARIRVLDAAGTERASAPVVGGIQVVTIADLDGDRRGEIYAGWGETREHRDTKARVTVHRLVDTKLVEETVIAPETTRQDVVALVPMPDVGALFVAYFESKYMVTSAVLRRDAQNPTPSWTAHPVATIRTATSYARADIDGDRTPDLIVGRVYGDGIGVDGDAFVLAADGTRTSIPTTRGVRALAAFDTDADGRAEVFLGDGWHQNYGQYAKSLLTWSRRTGTAFESTVIDDVPGAVELSRIVAVRHRGKLAVATLGAPPAAAVRLYTREGDRWTGVLIARSARDLVAGDVDGKPGDELLILGERSELIELPQSSPRSSSMSPRQ